MLQHIRVLDLTDDMGLYCGKLFADLGADVIKIEKPGGDDSRSIPPFFHDQAHPEKSLYFFYHNTNKRGITLNLETAAGRSIFKHLIKTTDVLLETFPTGYLDKLGLGFSALHEINPRLVMTSISGFGRTGPYKEFKALDIVGTAMGGLMSLSGWPDLPPMRPGGAPHGYMLACIHAMVGTLIALYWRELAGEGQHVDVSMAEAVSITQEVSMQYYDLLGIIRPRIPTYTESAVMLPMRGIYPCKNGYIKCYVGRVGKPATAVIDWMDSEGMAGDLIEERWRQVVAKLDDVAPLRPFMANPDAFPDLRAQFAHVDEVFVAFLMRHTKEEICEAAQQRNLMFLPVNTAEDLLHDPQLLAREFFDNVYHPELGATLRYPGTSIRFDGAAPKLTQRPPLIGEHNFEIYEKELGFTRREISLLKAEGVI